VRRLLPVIVFAGCMYANDARVEGPVLGYMFDPETRAVRAILGIPGSSRFSEPIPLGELALEKAWIAPGRTYAIAARKDTGLERTDLLTGKASEIAEDVPDQVVWSPKGSAAALFYRSGRIRVFTKMDSSPEPGIEASAGPDVSTMAVSDDGLAVLALRRTEQGTALIAFGEAGEQRLLLTAPGLNRVTFLNGTHDAIASDATEGKVYLLRNATELSILAQIDEPSAIAVSADNARVFVASKGRGRIASIAINDGAVTSFECTCAPTDLDRLQGSVLRLTGLSEPTVWLFNADAAENPFTFVPRLEPHRE
jgi:hypothetical protein